MLSREYYENELKRKKDELGGCRYTINKQKWWHSKFESYRRAEKMIPALEREVERLENSLNEAKLEERLKEIDKICRG